MSKDTKIQWTDVTWNIARGCTKVDEDCKFCYMYRDSLSGTRYNPLQVVKTKTVFDLPNRIKEPSRIFTCSLTDFFHDGCDSFRDEAWDIIRKNPKHTFQILTKRPERIEQCLPDDWGLGWKNVWLGTSVGNSYAMPRIMQLISLRNKTYTLFLSIEPLHEHLLLSSLKFPSPGGLFNTYALDFIDWVIVGGESGNNNGKYRYRPCQLEWIEDVVTDCQDHKVPVFVKQLGTHLAKERKMSDRHGGNIEEFPEHLRIREFPIFN